MLQGSHTELVFIKCDVDKGIPCKNCERSSAQCTLVGPAMRPPRNISGSTSAAAAAAVAVAVATATAAANAQSGASTASNINNGGDNEVDQSTASDDQTLLPFSNESGATKTSSLLVRRASASGQLMRVDESSGSIDAADASRGRRSLLSSSSSPTSLRALFNAGASAARSPTLSSSESAMQPTTLNSIDSVEGTLGSQNGDMDTHSSIGGTSTRIDYFDHPITYSESSSTTSTPSGAMMTNGMPHFGYTMDTLPSTVAHLISPLSSPLCHAQSASLPPTPFQLMAERLPESIITGASMNGLGTYPQSRPQYQTPTPHPRYSIARRASSSSYLPSSHSTENEIRIQQHDRRTSAPWTTYNHSQSLQYDNRHVSQTQAQVGGSNGVQSHQYGPTVHSIIRHHATTDDIQPYPTQSALMRSNSTPAALRSPLKTLNRNRHSALPSRRSHVIPTRQSLNLYASTDKVIQDLSLPQKLYRNSALPQRHVNNMSHLQFQLHLQQLQKSQQHGQRSQSLPRFQPDQSHRSPSQSSILQWQGYGAPQLRQQEADISFDLGVDNTHDVDMGIKSLPLGHSAPIGSDTSSDVIPADILSPLSTSSPTHTSVNDFQLFGNQMGRALDIEFGLAEDSSTSSNISGITQQDLLAQHHIHRPLSEEHAPKLQFAPGYAWKQEQGSDRSNGHTRHQSASQVYPQPPLHLQSSAQQRVNFTRSLQDLTRYTVLADQQHQPADQTRFLAQDTAMPHAPTLDRNASQDSYGASLAIDLNDHLRLLDDMDAMPEFGEYNEISQTSILSANHPTKDSMLQPTSIQSHPDQQIIGSIPTPPINDHQRSILSSITNGHNQMLLDNASINGTIGQGTEIHHFHRGPYVDTLSFLDLSGSFMAPTPVTVSMNAAATSSSLPNASFLDQQNSRISNPDQDSTIPDPDPSSHQVTDYQEGERRDIHGNIVQLGDSKPITPLKIESEESTTHQQSNDTTNPVPVDKSFEPRHPAVTDSHPIEAQEAPAPTSTLGTNKAVTAITQTIMKPKKNVVLPDYYEQFPDVTPNLLLTVPIGSGEMPMLGHGPVVAAEATFASRMSYYMRSAVDSVKSIFFSSNAKVSPGIEIKDKVQRGSHGIRKVVIIGVHGWFPRKALRTVIGEPTGTSRKFCEEMDLALKQYLGTFGKHLESEDVTLIPLDGEGKVMDRVEILHQSLVRNTKWRYAVHEADLVLVATHSQGTPTSILLISRWIEEGLLRVKESDPRSQKIGILAMAGITHGPFPFLKGNLILRWFEADAAKELFEFMDSESYIARKYQDALKTVLSSGVRLTCVASLDDQVVPLYSAVMTSIHHPSIVRAVYIDAASYQNDFLINLIAFSLRLRNAGVDDHGILVHLSEAIAGSLYGEGHSTIYEEREVYLLAIRSLLEPPAGLTPVLSRSTPILNPFRAKQRLNPFYLPWGMRGVADEILARGDQILIKELERLKKLYNEWNPATKITKEIKFRLEPVRSKL
ncbi:hypothetical protein BGZ76_010208 [Entomortierella beljakovae]|nr:hypothetical protein BGZ76_010208 [Entomortierella beljakovae]